MAEVYKKTLIHEWDFLGEERTEDERLTDTVGGVKAKLGYNASLQPEGIYLSYGDANYMKAYALMENVVGRGCLLEVDVASFKGNWDSDQHGRFIMMDDSSTSFDEGLVFNATKQLWCFNDSTYGWDEGFAGLDKNAWQYYF